MDAKLKYKVKKIKIVFFDIDDTLRVKDTGFIPDSFQAVEGQRDFDGYCVWTRNVWCRAGVESFAARLFRYSERSLC